MSATVDTSLSELSTTAESLGQSIAALQEKVQSLSDTIGDVADPESKVQEKEGELELVGGTFAIGAGLHESLRNDLGDYLELDPEEVSGAGNAEVLALSKIHGSAEKLSTGVEELRKVVSEKVSDIKSLKKVMKTEIDHIIKSVKSSDMDSNLRVVIDVFQKLNDEFDAQINSLQRVLDKSAAPVAKDLNDLIMNNKSFRSLAEKLGDTYNTSEGSDRLALAFTNLASLKTTASKVSDVLKSLKMSMEEYKNIKSAAELEKAVTKLLSQSDHKSAILKGLKFLKSSYPNHKEIVKELEKGGGAYSSAAVGRTSRTNHTTLKTRVKTYEDTVKEIFSIFIRQVGVNFSAIKSIFEVLGDSDVVYDDSLKTFIAVFQNFNSDLENGSVFYALVGLDQTVTGRELKNRFSANLEESILSLNSLQSQRLFKDVQTQLLEIKNTINSYSDIMNDTKREESRLNVEGGDLFTYEQTGIINVSKTIQEAILKLKFYGNLVMFKENLARVSKDYPDLQEGYDQLLGKSIGEKLTALQKEYIESVERLNDTERGRGWVLKQYNEKNPNKLPKGLVENIYKLQYDAKVGLYKTLEAIDLYLMHFTEKVSGDVNALKDLNELLSQTELIAAWADQTSVQKLEELYTSIIGEEFMTYAAAISQNSMVSSTVKSFTDGASIRKVLEACKQSVESIAVLRNIIAMFMKIGDKFSSGPLSKDNYMSSGTMYNNLVRYVWVSAFTMGHGTAGGDATVDANSSNGKGNYENEKGDKDYFFDLKMTSVTSPLDLLRTQEVKVRQSVESALTKLKNAGVSASDFTAGELNVIRAADANRLKAVVDLVDARNGETVKSLNNLLKSLDGKDIFQTEDKYFVLIMKSIAAKVLTVVGVSNILNRPSKVITMIANPVRSIVGANEVTVDSDTVELYIRLPLIVEFYKNIFGDGNEEYKKNKYAEDNTETIAFIPEMGSKWSGLIQCIFDESRQINSGIYSIENMKRIISEVNHIKSTYPKSQEARTIILDLVSEINRRYGVMKRKDMDDFYQSKKKYSTSAEVQYRNDFDILDPENSDMDSMGPSSGYVKETFEINTSKSQTSQDDISIVKGFRDLIRKELYSQDLSQLADKSFNERIKYFKQQVNKAKNNHEKVEVIIKAIDDSGDVSNFNVDVLTAYHELVRFPLSVLDRMYKHNMESIADLVLASYINDYSLTYVQKTIVLFCRSIGHKLTPIETKKRFENATEFVSKMSILYNDSRASKKYYNTHEDLKRLFDVIDVSKFAYSDPDNLKVLLAKAKNVLTKFEETDTLRTGIVTHVPVTIPAGALPMADPLAPPTVVAVPPVVDPDDADDKLEQAYELLQEIYTDTSRETPGLDIMTKHEIDNLHNQLIAIDPKSLESDYLLSIIAAYTPKETEVNEDALSTLYSPIINAINVDKAKIREAINQTGVFFEDLARRGKQFVSKEVRELIANLNVKKDKKLKANDLSNILKAVRTSNEVLKAARKFKASIHKAAVDKTDIPNDDKLVFDELHKSIKDVPVGGMSDHKGNLAIIGAALKEIKNPALDNFVENLIKNGSDEEVDIFINALTRLKKFNKPSATTFVLQNFKSNSIDLKYLSNSKIVLDYSRLQKEVENSIQLAKYVSSKYRHLVPQDVRTSSDSMISKIEHTYLFKMIYGQDNDKDPLLSHFNFEKCNVALNSLFDSFNKSEAESKEGYRIEILSYLYTSICDMDYTKVNEFKKDGGFLSEDNLSRSVVKEAFKTYEESSKQWTSFPNLKLNKLGNLSLLTSLYKVDNTLSDHSILLKFNNLVIRYVDTFFEESTKKFYAPLVADLCKSQSTCVYSGIGLKDMFGKETLRASRENNYIFSENDSILAESIGYTLKVLTTRDLVKQLDKKFYAQMNINEVSANMVDKYHTYLPIFIKMFTKIIDNCIVYKRMLELMSPEFVNNDFDNLKSEKDVGSGGTMIYGNSSDEEYQLGGKLVHGSMHAYSHISNTLNGIVEASRSMIQSAKSVLMEVDYNPKHLEIKQNFRKNFEENFKVMPVTPVSAITSTVNLLPSKSASSNDYKMTRGLNYILGDTDMDFPWLKNLLSDIRNSTTGDNSVDEARVMTGIKEVINLSQSMIDYSFFNKSGILDLETKTDFPGTDLSTFYNGVSVNDAVALSENSSVENSKKLLASTVSVVSKDVIDRPKARLLNMIDLNINPINPHALMREIPLINVYNYAFTFDDIVSNDFNVKANDLYKTNFAHDVKHSLAALLLDPYYNVDSVSNHLVEIKDKSKIIPESVGIVSQETRLRQALTNNIEINSNLKLGIGKYVKEIGNNASSVEFNTKFVRNLVFMTNLQRYLLSKIKNEVHRVNSRRVKSTDILSDRIVSYENKEGKLANNEFDLFEL